MESTCYRGAVMARWWQRPHASHQCGLGSIPARCHMLLFLALLWGFFSGYTTFPPSTKTNISKLQFHQDGGPAWIQLRKLSSSNIAAYCLLLFVTLVFDLLSGRNLNLINCTIWTELWTRAELIKWTNIFLSRIPSRGLFHLYSAVKPCKASTVKANRLKKIYIE